MSFWYTWYVYGDGSYFRLGLACYLLLFIYWSGIIYNYCLFEPDIYMLLLMAADVVIIIGAFVVFKKSFVCCFCLLLFT